MTCWLACSSRTPNAPLESWIRSVSSVVARGTGRGWNSFDCMKTAFPLEETLGPLAPIGTKHMQKISKDKKVSFRMEEVMVINQNYCIDFLILLL